MYVLSFGNLCCYMQESPSRFPCFHLALLTKQQTRLLRIATIYILRHDNTPNTRKTCPGLRKLLMGEQTFFSIPSLINSYAITVRTAARWAPRWRTPHIYILTGARPLESQVMSYHNLQGPCPAKVRLSYPSSQRHAGSHLARPGKGRGGGEAQNDWQCQGLLPPIFGERNFCTPLFLILGPGELHSGTLGAKMADSAHIYILRLVRGHDP